MNHEFFMKKALSLAARGKGKTSPNPMVGAVLVRNKQIIGSGYHRKHGSIHAEIEAINDALKRNPEADISSGTILYVTLEPCCHTEKINPPCCSRIINEKIEEVVVASIDPNPAVSGKGIRLLRESGIKVKTGILEAEEKKLNRIYHYCMVNHSPFIHLKMAQTLNSFSAKKDGSSKWISSIESRTAVHRMRAEYDSVMIGANTAVTDNPELTVRHVKGKQPLRLILDTGLRITENSKILNDKYSDKTHIFYNPDASDPKTVKNHSGKKYFIHPVSVDKKGLLSIKKIMRKVWELGARSVLVEGGSILAGELMIQKTVNRISLFISPQLYLDGIPSLRFHTSEESDILKQEIHLEDTEIKITGDNIHISGKPDFKVRKKICLQD